MIKTPWRADQLQQIAIDFGSEAYRVSRGTDDLQLGCCSEHASCWAAVRAVREEDHGSPIGRRPARSEKLADRSLERAVDACSPAYRESADGVVEIYDTAGEIRSDPSNVVKADHGCLIAP